MSTAKQALGISLVATETLRYSEVKRREEVLREEKRSAREERGEKELTARKTVRSGEKSRRRDHDAGGQKRIMWGKEDGGGWRKQRQK